ncbi:hypothetical protein A3D60_00685 [Candidatus Uhrbacteria bacterium RIFCSPHIGHO2_02_FULL_47_29]|nr:MAG: hypothetical protein A3D60_00685 [Candidatus Uhrbacteria bacterium RIFCSPHIGHO2_02_FULL_47_29]
MSTYKSLLIKIGLEEKEAEVYETLLSLGKTGMGKILNKVSLKRGSAYNAVYGLKAKGLVTELEEHGRKVFQVENPDRLASVLKTNEQSLKEAEQTLMGSLPSLKSAYNLIMHRPNVRFFEGDEGVRTVLEDSLTSHETIYSYIDNTLANEYFPKINEEYVSRRKRLGVVKRMISFDESYVRAHADRYRNALTEVRVVPTPPEHIRAVMQIYDGKISYLTLQPETLIGVIIEDERIYQMHRVLFELAWVAARPVVSLTTPTSSQPSPPAVAQA